MKLWEDIKNANSDLEEDAKISKQRLEKEIYFDNEDQSTGDAWLKMMIPHTIGCVVGIAVAKMFDCVFIGYFVFGIIFAYLAGVYKSVVFDKLSLKYALIRNAILFVRYLIISIFAAVFVFIFYKMQLNIDRR